MRGGHRNRNGGHGRRRNRNGGHGHGPGVCFDFQKGSCSRGAGCRFAHEGGVTGDHTSKRSAAENVRGQVKRHQTGGGQGHGNGGQHEFKSTQNAPLNPISRTTSTTRAALGNARFDQLAVCQPIKRAMADVFHYDTMTRCQEMTIPGSLTGKDVLAKAKTGTGKTLAFLIPSIHALQKRPRQERQGRSSILVISPTRELACQIEAEARQLVRFLDVSIMCVYGGTKVNKDLAKFRSQGFPDILVATPGRLNDHLENHGLAAGMSELKCLIFDEADQLLEMGFRPAIRKVLSLLPSKNSRQTLLFSATMPADVMDIAEFALRRQYLHIDCLLPNEQATHARVPQYLTVFPMETQFAQLYNVLEEGKRVQDYKILVFFVTARLAGLYSEVFNAMADFSVLEIHSRKSQSARTKASKAFRERSNVIMFSSDVTARGMDYPDVSMVVQMGMPENKAQYIHRLGRTARAGKGGCGVLLLSSFETYFLGLAKDEPFQDRAALSPGEAKGYEPRVSAAMSRLDPMTLTRGYQAWLGYYNTHRKKLRWSGEQLVAQANIFATRCCGLAEPPALLARTLGKMNLKNTPGIRVDRSGGGGNGGGRNGGGRNGGGRGGGGRGGGGRGRVGGGNRQQGGYGRY